MTPRLADLCPTHHTSPAARLGRWLVRGLTSYGMVDAMVAPRGPATTEPPCAPCGIRLLERHANGSGHTGRGTWQSA